MNNLVTVVVPVYNVEKYVEKCITSIVEQTYKNLEIIIINDGSSDNSPKICDEFAKIDSRIKVIHKKNEGAGMARNTGLSQANGDYICFFDSDDYIEPDTIEISLKTALSTNADMVLFGHDVVSINGKIISTQIPCPPKTLYEGEEIKNVLLPMELSSYQTKNEDWKISLSACNKLYSMKIITESGWNFVSERVVLSEDHYSLTELHQSLNRVAIIDQVLYHYVVNNTSFSRKIDPNRFDLVKNFYNKMIVLSERMMLEEVLNQPIKLVSFGLAISSMKQIVKSDLSFKRRYEKIKEIVNDAQIREIVKTTNTKNLGLQKTILYQTVKNKLPLLCYIIIRLKTEIN